MLMRARNAMLMHLILRIQIHRDTSNYTATKNGKKCDKDKNLDQTEWQVRHQHQDQHKDQNRAQHNQEQGDLDQVQGHEQHQNHDNTQKDTKQGARNLEKYTFSTKFKKVVLFELFSYFLFLGL